MRTGFSTERYDVERDMQRAAAAMADGGALLREKGGIPVTARGQTLLGHYSHSQTAVALGRGTEEDAIACTRRMIEYLGRLEDVALQPFSTMEGDTPAEAIGVAAASLEQLCADMEAHAVATGEPLEPDAELGIGTWKLVAQRLRVLEWRISVVPGQGEPAPLILPDVRG